MVQNGCVGHGQQGGALNKGKHQQEHPNCARELSGLQFVRQPHLVQGAVPDLAPFLCEIWRRRDDEGPELKKVISHCVEPVLGCKKGWRYQPHRRGSHDEVHGQSTAFPRANQQLVGKINDIARESRSEMGGAVQQVAVLEAVVGVRGGSPSLLVRCLAGGGRLSDCHGHILVHEHVVASTEWQSKKYSDNSGGRSVLQGELKELRQCSHNAQRHHPLRGETGFKEPQVLELVGRHCEEEEDQDVDPDRHIDKQQIGVERRRSKIEA
mmetsp:Transcript_93916/g.214742  ORF Transcript_93916/g.214742 Transcript_93916/m.214742 type:complete len:267 (-) Transcript_93916:1878-2678(-)